MKNAFSSIAAIFVVVFIVALLSSCDAANNLFATPTPSFTPTPSATFTPTATFTPSPTSTPSPTPTPQLPVLEGTPIPPLSEEISPENISKVMEMAKWGPEMGRLTNASISPDGKYIILATSLGVYFYDADTLELADFLPSENSVTFFAISPDGKTIALAYSNITTIRLFDMKSKKSINTFEDEKNASPITSLAMSPDGKWLAAGFENGNISVWNTAENGESRDFGKHKSAVTRLFFSPDNKLLYSGSQKSQVQIYDVVTKSLFRKIERYTDGMFRYMSLSADGSKLATIGFSKGGFWGSDIRIMTWDMASGGLVNEIKNMGSSFKDYELSPDGIYFAVLHATTINLWDVTGKKAVSVSDIKIPQSQQRTASFVLFSPKNRSVKFVGHGLIVSWDLRTRDIVSQTEIETNYIYDVAFSPNINEIALIDTTFAGKNESTYGYKTINLLDETPKFTQQKNLWSIAYNPSGKIASGLDGQISDNGINFKAIASDKVHQFPVVRLAISTDGNYYAARDNYRGYIMIYDKTGKTVKFFRSDWNESAQRFDGSDYESLEFSSDGQYLLFGAGNLRLASTADWTVITKATKVVSNSAVFSPDSKFVGYAQLDKSIQIVSVPDFKTVLSIPSPNDEETVSLAFSPNGKVLAAGTKGGLIRFWDMRDGTLLREIKGHTDKVKKLFFTLDSKILFSISDDALIRLWGIKPW